jgi:hypothetical protein
MFNVNQITSQLAKMPDQALQQYAAMHKNDPYTVSLALAESNRRKDMRMGATPQPGQMPKVVDQDIAQMMAPPPQQIMPQQARPQMPQQLPENTGIGQLPAQNMQGMADGGIVGYAEGGVPRYQGNTTDGSLVQLPGGLGILQQGSFGPQAGNVALEKRIAAIQSNPRMRAEDKANLIAQIKQEFFKTPAPAATVIPTQTAVTTPAVTTSQTVTPPAVTPPAGTPPATASASPLASLDSGSGQGIKVAPAAGLPSVDAAFNKLMGVLPKEKTVESEEIFTEKRLAPYAEFDKRATGMIDKQKDQLKTDKEQEFYMSLIEGGLAAAGEGGPNAIQNIAKGFSKGVGRYGEALKDFRKASQENSKMELELTKAQADRKVGNMDKYQERIDKADEHNKSLAIAKASGLSTLLGQDIHGKYSLAQADISGRYHLAGAGASARAQQNLMEALGNAAPDSALRKGFDLTKLEGQIQKGYEAWQTRAYDKTTGMPNDAFIKMYPTPDAYIQEFLKSAKAAEGTGFINIPNPQATGAPIRQR